MLTSVEAVSSHANALDRDARYRQASDLYAGALARLARGYERDADARRDLLQEIHVALWQSFAVYDGRCSLRTWVYRVAHNVATAHLTRARRANASALVDIESLDAVASSQDVAADADTRRSVARLLELIERLAPLERQVILLYLEGVEATEIGDIVGLSASNVATRVHRIKALLRRRFEVGASDER